MIEHFKVLQGFNISTSDIPQSGENRSFTISGELGVVFSLVVKNEANKYYNLLPQHILVLLIFQLLQVLIHTNFH